MTSSLKKGDLCVACPGGRWARMKVLRCNADETFKLLPEGSSSFFDEWHGVTREEISFDEEAIWPRVFDAIRGGRPGVGMEEALATFVRTGSRIDREAMAKLWGERCLTLFDTKEAGALVLDGAQAYRFFLSCGASASLLADPVASDPSRDLYKLYWNGIRMGGRSPGDVGRPIHLEDALLALGLESVADDAKTVAALARFELANALTLPTSLKDLWAKESSASVLMKAHCNAPEPLAVEDWTLRRRNDEPWDAPYAVRIMTPHQGDHAWWALFDDRSNDAEVWVSFQEDGGPVRRVARSVPFFFWDLRETSRSWERARDDEANERRS